MFSAGSTLPVHVAFVEKMFERHGLAVELTEGQDLPVFMAALAKAEYDIALSGPTLVLIGAERKLELEIVSAFREIDASQAQCRLDHQGPVGHVPGPVEGQGDRRSVTHRHHRRRVGVSAWPREVFSATT